MRIRNTKIFLAILILSSALSSAQDGDVLLSVNNNEIKVDEFRWLYNKNNTGATRSSVEEYIRLYINFKLKVENRKCEIFIENELRLTKTFTNNPGNIVGFKFKFNGAGKLDMVKLQDHNQTIVFEDAFDHNL